MIADLASIALVALLVGMLIGAAGIGGVLLAPWLAHGVDLPVQQAVGIAMLGFVGPGLVALLGAWQARTRCPIAWPLVLATAPGALVGAAAFAWLPERLALVVLSVALALIGVRMLAGLAYPSRVPDTASATRAGVPTGLAVGFGSALTVTSGAVVLTPLLIARGVPLPEVIALAQVVQLPIAGSATAVNLALGSVDIAMGAAVGATMVPGVLLGRRIGDRLPRTALVVLVSVLLLLAAAMTAAKAWR